MAGKIRRDYTVISPSSRRREGHESPLTQPVTIPGIAILPLRLFLAVTFVYAGVQKLTDPNFFKAGTPTYIGAQILAFSRNSPIRPILLHMMEHAVIIGWLTIATEVAIGAAVLLGLFTRPAAIVGFILNFGFFLSASWHTYPYFFGSDVVFCACWLTLTLTGPGPFALDRVVEPGVRKALMRQGLSPSLAGTATGGLPVSRRDVIVGTAASIGLILLGLLPKTTSVGGATSLAGGKTGSPSANPTAGTAPTSTARGSSTGSSGSSTAPVGYHKIGNTRQLPSNSAGMVQDPRSGDPDIIINVDGKVYAYDAVCTHAGCTVQYDPQQKLIICPCHGGEYNPVKNAEVVAGPPPAPLSAVPIKIASNGDIYIS